MDWKDESELWSICKNNYAITVIYPDGAIENAIWHYSMSWLETESSWSPISGWKPR